MSSRDSRLVAYLFVGAGEAMQPLVQINKLMLSTLSERVPIVGWASVSDSEIRHCTQKENEDVGGNRAERDKEVRELLEMIDNLVQANKGKYYTNDMYKRNEKNETVLTDIQGKKWRTSYFPVEVGCRSFVSQTCWRALGSLGLTGTVRRSLVGKVRRQTQEASGWVWRKREKQ
ncbi:unnamed protein product [Mytilus coruscus]|uniref:Uncharacterized protein n=1 Tax=Mytilus coruscus TaxID=42192 RepID=A0A6J7ZVG7_MYTCO|nr:unnamed protein product [Mytilus coruscus]